ncbi:hypothetical protein QEN19_001468 [Hanseniaspora menglaensis]
MQESKSAPENTPESGSRQKNKKDSTFTWRFRNPIVSDPDSGKAKYTLKSKFQIHRGSVEKLKRSNTNPESFMSGDETEFKNSNMSPRVYSASSPPLPATAVEFSPLQTAQKPLESKKSLDLVLSPSSSSYPSSFLTSKTDDNRRFSLGLMADNQLPISAVYDHNMMGSELGNEFSMLNEFLNLLDPDQQQLNPHTSIKTPMNNGKNSSFSAMSPGNGWMSTNSGVPSPAPNLLGIPFKSPAVYRELPNIAETESLVNNYESISTEKQAIEPDYRHHPYQRPIFQRNKFTKNYTKHNFPTLKNAQHANTIYAGRKNNQTKAIHKRVVKQASYTVSAKEKFFLTAAAPSAVLHAKERLTEVIKAKLDAGLLKPYDYSKGYDRIHDFLTDSNATMSVKKRVYKVLNDLRPKYAEVTSKLKSVELVLVEESFEVMLLSLERVFSTIATPSCCWRRTGEIYRGNQEFATLAGCDIEDLRDGRLSIYELMNEESYCKYFELFGYSSSKPDQKAILTHCNLKNRDVNCCFSFTIKRDEYNIPICVIGNFLPSE